VLDEAYTKSNELAKRLQSFRKSLVGNARAVKEETALYLMDEI
jgi:hypothetical protein